MARTRRPGSVRPKSSVRWFRGPPFSMGGGSSTRAASSPPRGFPPASTERCIWWRGWPDGRWQIKPRGTWNITGCPSRISPRPTRCSTPASTSVAKRFNAPHCSTIGRGDELVDEAARFGVVGWCYRADGDFGHRDSFSGDDGHGLLDFHLAVGLPGPVGRNTDAGTSRAADVSVRGRSLQRGVSRRSRSSDQHLTRFERAATRTGFYRFDSRFAPGRLEAKAPSAKRSAPVGIYV